MRILVVYYTQSGQLREIVKSVTGPLLSHEDTIVEYEEITPAEDFPFPWGKAFFDCFPESVNGTPVKLLPFSFDSRAEYDLVILAYQSWFLSPSIPFSSFLGSPEARALLKGKPVVTVLGVRNMWVTSQEIVKRKLAGLGARLAGNIVFTDRHNNWVAGITIIRWLVHGRKGRSGIWPAAGVSEQDIREAARFGETLYEAVSEGSLDSLQERLLKQKAVKVKFSLMLTEINARRIFVKFAHRISSPGGQDAGKRKRGIRLFKTYLIFALFVISPLVSLIFTITGILLFPLANRQTGYYEGVTLKR